MKPFILTAAALTFAATAQAEQATPLIELSWRSSSESDQLLPNQITDLYLTLYNSGNMIVKPVPNPKGAYIEVLARDAGVFYGSFFPVEMDALLCDMNPDICRRSLTPASARELADVTAHVGGYRPSQGKWRLLRDTTIQMPAYGFTPVTTLAKTPVPAGWTPDSFEQSPQMDCSDYGQSCADVVKGYNPPIIKSTRALDGAQAVLPQVRLETTIPLREDEVSQFRDTIAGLAAEQSAGGAMAEATYAQPNFTANWADTLSGTSSTDLTIKALNNNIRSIGRASKFGTLQDEPWVMDQMELFELINHPFKTLEELPAAYRRPVGIVVVDSPIGFGHCDWNAATMAARASPHPGDNCRDIDNAAVADADHAAHVAGLISAKQNGKGMIGLNPFANMSFAEFDRNMPVINQIDELTRQVQFKIPTDVRIANLSFGIETVLGGLTDIREAIDARGKTLLIVAAAGNSNTFIPDQDCRLIPACLTEFDNVITVVGLNRNAQTPDLWHSDSAGSNSSPHFHIGAVAQDVLSTVSHDKFAKMSGTSQAAPQVAAAASLIYSAGELIYGVDLPGGRLAPKIVKDRLIYTADIFTGLQQSVYSGRLNTDRAIHVRDAQFVLTDGRVVTGTVKDAPDEYACRSADPNLRLESWWATRRLVFNPDRGTYLIFKTEDRNGDRSSKLLRRTSCNLNTLSRVVQVQPVDGGPDDIVSFAFSEIRDYTSPLFDE